MECTQTICNLHKENSGPKKSVRKKMNIEKVRILIDADETKLMRKWFAEI